MSKSFHGLARASAAALIALCTLSLDALAADAIRVGATPVPHADILNFIKPKLAAQGIELKVIEFSDYIQPNAALASGDLEANYFQPIPYVADQNKQHGYKLKIVAPVHLEPMGLYSKKVKNVKDLPDGALIAVPNNPTNEGRALKVLEGAGLIRLKDGSSLHFTVLDIVDNPHKFKFVELDPAQLPHALEDVAAGVINANYALEAGLNPARDAIAVESETSPFANVLVVREGDEEKPEIQKLKAAITSPEVKAFIQEKYQGGVIPTF